MAKKKGKRGKANNPDPQQQELTRKAREAVRRDVHTACLMTDLFFRECLAVALVSEKGKEIAKKCITLILRTITGLDDIVLKTVIPQLDVPNYGGHSAILDVFAEDYKGRIFIIEIENSIERAVFARLHHNAMLISTRYSQEGTDVPEARDVYAVCITQSMVKDCDYQDGIAGSRSPSLDSSSGKVLVEDQHCFWAYTKYHKVSGGNEVLKAIMHDMVQKNPDDMLIDCFKELVKFGKGDGGEYIMLPHMKKVLADQQKEYEAERERLEAERKADLERFEANLERIEAERKAERGYWVSFIQEKLGPKGVEEAERNRKAMLLRNGRGRIRLKSISAI